ncbi:F-box protein dampened [Cochliomyia hominivorax]
MVSTRQMATSSGGSGVGGNGSGGGTTNSILHNSSLEDSNSLRPSVVTRQSSYTTSVVNTMPSSSSLSAAAASVSTAYTTSCVRQTQAFKNYGNITNSITGCIQQQQQQQVVSSSINLLDLPEEILYNILSYIGYKKIGQLRVISHKMNEVCMHLLNSTFSKLITKTYNRFQAIKANMPRRESARRNHPLACECDIIETCYMRLSLLQMTFGKHIERGHCCFFPGAILDEVYTILNYIKNTPCLERPYRVTDELFDLSTMAMEYFRDRIEPTLPGIAYFNKDFFKLSTTTKRPLVIASDLTDSPASIPSPPQSNMVLRKGIRKIKQGMKIYNNQLSVLRNELRTCKRKSAEQGKQIAEQQKLLAEQRKQTLEYANRLDENDKKNEEMSRKFSTLLQELNKCKTELQYWRSKSPAIPTCTSCGQKVTPILPPEDYQALINQGVKPEDIILNLNDDTDAESDVSLNDSGCNNLSNEFVFPDEATTAKLLAVNTATKNLKRQHNAILDIAASKNNTTTTSNIQNVNTKIQNNETTELTDFFDINEASTSSSAFIATAGYSPRLFYGSSNNIIGTTTTTPTPHKSVIVSPQSQLKQRSIVISENVASVERNDINVVQLQTSNEASLINGGNTTSNGGVDSGACSINNVSTMEDVNNLQAISSHETKKARRVQKTTRCLNNSGNKRK